MPSAVVVLDAVGLNGPRLPEGLVADAVDVGARHLRELRAQPHGLPEGANGMGRELWYYPVHVLLGLQAEKLRGHHGRGHTPAFPCDPCLLFEVRLEVGRSAVVKALSVSRDDRIEIDQPSDSCGGAVGRRADDYPAVAMSDQHDVGEIFGLEYRHDVRDVGVQADLSRREVRALPEAGQRRGVDVGPARLQLCPDLSPAPTAVPGAMHQDVRVHAVTLLRAQPGG